MTTPDKPRKPGWFERWLGHDDPFDQDLNPDDAREDGDDHRD